ncbi:MAG: hypothetical protein GY953_42930 [bacterium]|nr:hypothetical protein [bacterium]
MLPAERELVKRMAGKPFTLLRINVDESRSALKKIIEKERITWPNIRDGPPVEGEIADTWNVRSYRHAEPPFPARKARPWHFVTVVTVPPRDVLPE